MKRTFTLIACVAICCAMMASCKNAKTAEPTPEEIQAQKVALADSVLAEIDAFANEFFLASEKDFNFAKLELTEEEKMLKPDYLLDPSFANTLVTKSQKVNALAFYIIDCFVRKVYDMPLDEIKEAITKLTAELNHPLDVNVSFDFEMPVSEKVKNTYEECRERGELDYYWQFENAIMVETGYIIAQNPELFFSKITEEQWQGFMSRSKFKNEALAKLSQYDEEIAAIMAIRAKYRAASSYDDFKESNATIESAKQFRIANRDKFIARRNALLQ